MRNVFILSLVAMCTFGLLVPMISGVSNTCFVTAATDISLTIDFGNGTIQEFQGLEGNDVYGVTSNATSVEVEWYGDLVYITSISGVTESDAENLYWQYWVNGELGGSAANKYVLQEGDHIEWKLPSQTSDSDTATSFQIDMSLIIGGGLLGAVMVSVLVMLWLKQKRG